MEVSFDSQETVGFIPSGMNLVLNHEAVNLGERSTGCYVQPYLGHQKSLKAKWLRAKNLKTLSHYRLSL